MSRLLLTAELPGLGVRVAPFPYDPAIKDSHINRVDEAFRAQRMEGARSVIPFVVGGHPSLAATALVLPALADAGARVIEIGVPFSDPIADGPTISEAMRRAIESGTTPASLFKTIASARSKTKAAIVLMVSISIVERMGRDRFVGDAQAAGADGLVIPDVDLDEAPALQVLCARQGLTLSMLVAPATGPERLRRLAAASSGFIYLLARQGVTGNAVEVDSSPLSSGSRSSSRPDDHSVEIGRRVRDIRTLTSLPIACGFGISTREQVTAVTAHADAAIVGSAIVRAMSTSDDPATAAKAAAQLVRDLSGISNDEGRRSPPPGSSSRRR